MSGAVGLVAVVLAAVVTGNGDGVGTQVTVGAPTGTTGGGTAPAGGGPTTTMTHEPVVAEPTTTAKTVTTSTVSPTTRPPVVSTTMTDPPAVRRSMATIAASGGGTWTLFSVEDGGDSCVELVSPGGETARALCNAAPAVGPIGDLASFSMGRDWAVVTVVAPSIDGLGFRAYGGAPWGVIDGAVGVDPARPAHAFAAKVLRNGTGIATSLFLLQDEDTVGRVRLPAGAITVPRSLLDLSTEAPYGRWPGYRIGAFAGLWWGGYQEVGFYDGPSGTPCVLHRRLGSDERVLYDGCPAFSPGLAFAGLAWDGPGHGDGRSYQPVLVIDGPATAWRCEPVTCDPYKRNVLVADPAGSGRSAGVLFANALARDLELVVVNGDEEVGRVTLPYPTGP